MKLDLKLAWVALLGLALLALVMFFVAVARADVAASPSPFVQRLVAAQASLRSKKDEPVDALELANAVASVSKGNRDWAALLLTIAAHESHLSARIARGECKPLECDRGRSAGIFQVKKNAFNAATWGSTNLVNQVRDASRALTGAFHQCGGLKRADWPLRTVRAYGTGRGCDGKLPDEAKRMATFERLRTRL